MTNKNDNEHEEDWPLIYKYTANEKYNDKYIDQDIVRDNILFHLGHVGAEKVYFTGNLLFDGYHGDDQKIISLVNRGLDLLQQPNKEDTRYMKFRVIEKDKVWVVHDDDGIKYMKPEDY